MAVIGTRLPHGYQEVEYIESTGTQYINTNINHSTYPNAVFYHDIQFTNLSSRQLMGVNSGNGYWGIKSGRYEKYEVTNINAGNRDIVEIGYNFYLKVNGVTAMPGSLGWTPDYNYSILNITQSPYYNCSVKLYSFKCYNSQNKNQLYANYIPCIRKSDNTVGMYDIVSKQFFTNQGTGSFIAGPNKYYRSVIAMGVRRQ